MIGEVASITQNLLRRLVASVIFLIYLFAATLGGLWIIYLVRVERPVIVEPEIAPKYSHILTPQTFRKLGILRMDLNRSFLKFPFKKPAGTIRIGCFGDSFTAGDEVMQGEDYPSQLQEVFEEHNYENVEVINFGSSWHGAHQSFILWQEIGSKYDLDYVLLGPTILRFDRDYTFNHGAAEAPSYIHSRYILDERGDLRRLDIPGDSLKEIYENYSAFFPPWIVLRYDFFAPPVIRSFLAHGRYIKNPFYYRRDREQAESEQIFQKLVTQVEASGSKVVIIDHAAGKFMPNSQLYVRDSLFPYFTPQTHNSPIGNRLVALLFFSKLTGMGVKERHLGTVAPLESTIADHRKFTPLRKYSSVVLKHRDELIGQFSDISVPLPGDHSLFGKMGVDSILTIKNPDLSLLDAVWIPIPKEISHGDVVTIIATVNGEKRKFLLGKIELLRSGIGIGFVNTAAAERISLESEWLHRMKVKLNSHPDASESMASNWQDGLYVAKDKIADIEILADNFAVAIPKQGSFFAASASENRFSIENIRNQDVINLVLSYGHSGIRIPFGRFVVEDRILKVPGVVDNSLLMPTSTRKRNF